MRWVSSWAGVLLLSAGIAAAADVAALRQRWQEMLLREPSVLAPERNAEAEAAMNAFEDAARRRASDLEVRMQDASRRLDALDAAVGRVHAAWPAVLTARGAARTARVHELLPREWREAENILAAAARKLEAGRADTGARQAEDARARYEAARLATLRGGVLGEAQAMLRRLDALEGRKYVPRSYVRALDAVQAAEARFKADGGDGTEVRAAAARATSEAQHALFLLERVRGACGNDASRLEATILEWEDDLRRVLAALGAEASFETSLSAGLPVAAERATALVRERQRVLGDAERGAGAADSLQRTVRALQDSLRQRELRWAEARRRSAEFERLQRVQQLFTRDEGRVLLDNRDVVLRLHGLTFGPGSAALGAEAAALLDKVVQAVRAFPGATLVVEGHTDGQGKPETNLALSQQRADAVRTVLLERALVSPARVTAVGLGSTRPVVAEFSDAERALNRRIEIILAPGD